MSKSGPSHCPSPLPLPLSQAPARKAGLPLDPDKRGPCKVLLQPCPGHGPPPQDEGSLGPSGQIPVESVSPKSPVSMAGGCVQSWQVSSLGLSSRGQALAPKGGQRMGIVGAMDELDHEPISLCMMPQQCGLEPSWACSNSPLHFCLSTLHPEVSKKQTSSLPGCYEKYICQEGGTEHI